MKLLKDVISAILASIPIVYYLVRFRYIEVVSLFYYSNFSLMGYTTLFWSVHLIAAVLCIVAIYPLILYRQVRRDWPLKKELDVLRAIPFIILSYIAGGVLNVLTAFSLPYLFIFGELPRNFYHIIFETSFLITSLLFWVLWYFLYLTMKFYMELFIRPIVNYLKRASVMSHRDIQR